MDKHLHNTKTLLTAIAIVLFSTLAMGQERGLIRYNPGSPSTAVSQASIDTSGTTQVVLRVPSTSYSSKEGITSSTLFLGRNAYLYDTRNSITGVLGVTTTGNNSWGVGALALGSSGIGGYFNGVGTGVEGVSSGGVAVKATGATLLGTTSGHETTITGATINLPNIPAGNIDRIIGRKTGSDDAVTTNNISRFVPELSLYLRTDKSNYLTGTAPLQNEGSYQTRGGDPRPATATDLQAYRTDPSFVASGGFSGVLSGGDNRASGDYSLVSGGFSSSSSGYASTVSGGAGNTASGDASTVGGGGANTASYDHATVSGGNNNTASGYSATVGGGDTNGASGFYSTTSGGISNSASGVYSTISGGSGNDASGPQSAIAGGDSNEAQGSNSFVMGGSGNVVSGDFSASGGRSSTSSGNYALAWGYNADATHAGSVVIVADDSSAGGASVGADTFNVYAAAQAYFKSPRFTIDSLPSTGGTKIVLQKSNNDLATTTSIAAFLPSNVVTTDAPAEQTIDNGIASLVERTHYGVANRYDPATWTVDWNQGYIGAGTSNQYAYLDLPFLVPGTEISSIYVQIFSQDSSDGGYFALVRKRTAFEGGSCPAWEVVLDAGLVANPSGGDCYPYTFTGSATVEAGYAYSLRFISEIVNTGVDLHLLGITISKQPL